jgi:hypothetical protein
VNGIPLAQAAKELRRHPATLRRWIKRDGCPTVELGEVGRGKGSLVDLEQVKRWRAEHTGASTAPREDERILSVIAESFSDCLKRDEAHRRVDMKHGPASGLLALCFQRVWQNVTRRPLHEFVPPPEIEHLCAIWVQWRER